MESEGMKQDKGLVLSVIWHLDVTLFHNMSLLLLSANGLWSCAGSCNAEYLKKIGKATAQRILALQHSRSPKFNGLLQAYDWVKANKANFKGEVYGPLITEVTVKGTYHADALEQVVSTASWSCFVTNNMWVISPEQRKRAGGWLNTWEINHLFFVHRDDLRTIRREIPALKIMDEVNVVNVNGDPEEILKTSSQTVVYPEWVKGVHVW